MTAEQKKLKVLFLCTGNSCRSQMAQGLANHYKADQIEAYSAGTNPCYVHPKAVEVMAEIGIDISHHTSKHLNDLRDINFDYVITVCDNAKQNCPLYIGSAKKLHKSFPDPASPADDPRQKLENFRRVRDMIKNFVLTLPEALKN